MKTVQNTENTDVGGILKGFLTCKDYYYINNNKMVGEKIFIENSPLSISELLRKLNFEYDSCIVIGNKVKDLTVTSSFSPKIKNAIDVSQKRMAYESLLFKGMEDAMKEGMDNENVYLQYKTASELVRSMKSVEDSNWSSLIKEISTGKVTEPINYSFSFTGIVILLILLFVAGFYSVSKKFEDEQEKRDQK